MGGEEFIIDDFNQFIACLRNKSWSGKKLWYVEPTPYLTPKKLGRVFMKSIWEAGQLGDFPPALILDFSDCEITRAGAKYLRDLLYLPNISKKLNLNLRDCKIASDMVREIVIALASHNFTKLNLNLSNISLQEDDLAIILKCIRKNWHIDLGNGLNNNMKRFFDIIPALPPHVAIDCANHRCGNVEMDGLADKLCQIKTAAHLKLNFSNNKLSNLNLHYFLQASTKFPSHLNLDFSDNDLSDEILYTLSETISYKKLPAYLSLDFSHNQISTSAAEYFLYVITAKLTPIGLRINFTGNPIEENVNKKIDQQLEKNSKIMFLYILFNTYSPYVDKNNDNHFHKLPTEILYKIYNYVLPYREKENKKLIQYVHNKSTFFKCGKKRKWLEDIVEYGRKKICNIV